MIQSMQEGQTWVWRKSFLTVRRLTNDEQQSKSVRLGKSLVEHEFGGESRGFIDLDYDIEMQREFIHEQSLGFTWHKSWIIPRITFRFTKQTWNNLLNAFPKTSFKGELLSVIQKKDEGETAEQIQLNKNPIVSFQQQAVVFSNFKFLKTSFQFQREKIYLIINVLALQDHQQPRTVLSLISPSIYVDSRREARINNLRDQIYEKRPKVELDQFFQPIRMHNGKKNAKVDNSIKGFLDYYTAQNIRNKVKDPFYIAYHFCSAFRVYINQNRVRSCFEAMKVIQSSFSDSMIVAFVPIGASGEQVKRLRALFDKSFKFNNVGVEFSEQSLDNKKWLQVTRKHISSDYKQFFEDEEEFDYVSQSLNVFEMKPFKHTTELVLQTGSIERTMEGNQITRQQRQSARPVRVIHFDILKF